MGKKIFDFSRRYSIPPEHGRRLERLATGFFPSNARSCLAFLRHKTTLISPPILKQYSIPYNKVNEQKKKKLHVYKYGCGMKRERTVKYHSIIIIITDYSRGRRNNDNVSIRLPCGF